MTSAHDCADTARFALPLSMVLWLACCFLICVPFCAVQAVPVLRHVRRVFRTGEFDEKVAKLYYLSFAAALNVRKNSELSSLQISQFGSCGVPASLRKTSTLSSHHMAMLGGCLLWSDLREHVGRGDPASSSTSSQYVYVTMTMLPSLGPCSLRSVQVGLRFDPSLVGHSLLVDSAKFVFVLTSDLSLASGSHGLCLPE